MLLTVIELTLDAQRPICTLRLRRTLGGKRRVVNAIRPDMILHRSNTLNVNADSDPNSMLFSLKLNANDSVLLSILASHCRCRRQRRRLKIGCPLSYFSLCFTFFKIRQGSWSAVATNLLFFLFSLNHFLHFSLLFSN